MVVLAGDYGVPCPRVGCDARKGERCLDIRAKRSGVELPNWEAHPERHKLAIREAHTDGR
jgi:hypothetical protein